MEQAIDVEQPAKTKKVNLGAIFVILAKVGTKIFTFLLKFIKFILFGASFVAYSYMFTWEFAGMLVAMILIHEYGHVYAMRKCGVKVKGIYLIPFVCGAAVAESDFKTRRDEAYIAIMGPIFGFACCVVIAALYFITKNPLFAAGASWLALINLFNLLPVNPLDGGRILKSIAFSIHSVVGLLILFLSILTLAAIAWYGNALLFVLLAIVGIIELIFEFKKSRDIKKEKRALEQIKEGLLLHKINNNIDEIIDKYCSEKPVMTLKQILLYVFAYVVVTATLFVFMYMTEHVPGAAAAMEALK